MHQGTAIVKVKAPREASRQLARPTNQAIAKTQNIARRFVATFADLERNLVILDAAGTRRLRQIQRNIERNGGAYSKDECLELSNMAIACESAHQSYRRALEEAVALRARHTLNRKLHRDVMRTLNRYSLLPEPPADNRRLLPKPGNQKLLPKPTRTETQGE